MSVKCHAFFFFFPLLVAVLFIFMHGAHPLQISPPGTYKAEGYSRVGLFTPRLPVCSCSSFEVSHGHRRLNFSGLGEYVTTGNGYK